MHEVNTETMSEISLLCYTQDPFIKSILNIWNSISFFGLFSVYNCAVLSANQD